MKGEERLQKLLAHAGVGSRRACEELILQGRVAVDGKVVRELGTKVNPNKAVIAVDGQKIREERHVYFAVYKPKGYVSTNNDPSGRPRVLDLLPEVPQRVYTIGRLDEASTGLILLTNDGELANKLAHPKFGVEKIYKVVVAGSPSKEIIDQLTEGIWLAEGKVRAKRVRVVGKRGESTILEMVLAEGRNREVRRMLAKLGHKVMTLTRIAVGPVSIKGLKSGDFRPLTSREIEMLHRAAAGEFRSSAREAKGDARPRRDRPVTDGPQPRRPGAPAARPSLGGPASRSSGSRPAPRPRPDGDAPLPTPQYRSGERPAPNRERGPARPAGPRAFRPGQNRDETQAPPQREGRPALGPAPRSRRPETDAPAPRSRRPDAAAPAPRPRVEPDVIIPAISDVSEAKRPRRIIGVEETVSSSARPMPKARRAKPPRRLLGDGPKPKAKRREPGGED